HWIDCCLDLAGAGGAALHLGDQRHGRLEQRRARGASGLGPPLHLGQRNALLALRDLPALGIEDLLENVHSQATLSALAPRETETSLSRVVAAAPVSSVRAATAAPSLRVAAWPLA